MPLREQVGTWADARRRPSPGQPLPLEAGRTTGSWSRLPDGQKDGNGQRQRGPRTPWQDRMYTRHPKTGLWASQEVRDSLWPAQDQRTRPLMPLRRGHMAMLVAAGFLDNLVLEAEGRRILVKGRTTKELVLAEETENTEVAYRERLKTTVVALDLDDGEITDIAA